MILGKHALCPERRQAMRGRVLLAATVSLLALGLLAVACGDDEEEEAAPTATVQEVAPTATVDEAPAAGSDVEVLLDEWSVVANPSEVPAGPVTFTAVNAGDEDHELVVLKTDLAADALPVVDSKVDEVAAGEEIGEIEDV